MVVKVLGLVFSTSLVVRVFRVVSYWLKSKEARCMIFWSLDFFYFYFFYRHPSKNHLIAYKIGADQ